MKAAIYKKYGSPEMLELVDLPQPTPQRDEVLIKIMATSVTQVDTAFRSGSSLLTRLYTGLFKPKHSVLGTELSGIIESVGENVTKFEAGNRVFAAAPNGFGAHAQYICVSENAAIATMPDTLGFEEAAVIDNGALTALPFLRDTAKLQASQSILIIGASGSIGTYAVQLAAAMGAEVTGVCGPTNQEMVHNLGASHVIDYTKEDFTKSAKTYDVIFDTVGSSSFGKCCNILAKRGIFIAATPDISTIISPLFRLFTGGKRAKMAATGMRKDHLKIKDMNYLKEMMADGKLTAVIDRSYPLEQIKDAHSYVEAGHKRGNLVITVAHDY